MSSKEKKPRKFHELETGAHDHLEGLSREIAAIFQRNEVLLYLGLFEETNYEPHLWRAWKTARTFSNVEPTVVELFAPHFDKIASARVKHQRPRRADQHVRRNSILASYYYLKQHLPNETTAELYRRVAADHRTTSGSVQQMVLEFEERGQRGERRAEMRRTKKNPKA